ncbi:ankyrin repeat domain-containing protein [Treponema sp.]|uniref:ankyrin repeat domain-containing protein n=1 Tax=Treponema sp. TaxID=166 RepID=UPI00298E31BF|nr:ankyrin repeat domain-containing protein [Treponema sp.]MCR5612421.1 ankyrin repeat domain-containing protein [Treponema sp.]
MKKFNFLFIAGIFILASGCKTTQKEPQSIQALIRQGKTEEAKSFFMSKSDINSPDEDGNTVLHIASLMNDDDLVTFLIIKGADKEIKNYQSQTPLILAIENDCFDSVRALTAAGADVFAKDAEGVCALERALDKNEVYYDIMINEATAKLRDSDGRTIIHYFVSARDEKALEYAVKQNLPIDIQDNNSVTPLKLALADTTDAADARMAAALLLAGAKECGGKTKYFEEAVLSRNLSLTMEDGQTPLHFAAIRNHKGIIDFLLASGADTSSQDINGSTPLHEACRHGNVDIARALLEARANVNAQDSLCKTPLLLIIPEEARIDIYKLLIEYKADINHKDMYGDTVLHTASMTNLNTDILTLFFEAGADINIRNKKGNTALATAVEHELKDQVEFYVNNGADIHAEDASHVTPFTKVLFSNNGLFETMINSSNINSVDSEGNTPLLIAIQKNASLEKIKYLIELGSNVNARNRDGNSALYFAVKNNKKDVGVILLAKNANIFSANTQDVSPLKLALTQSGSEWLINSNTIIATDGSGNTALHYAADWKLTSAVDFLVQKGAKIDARNANGQTALFNAARADDAKIVNKLLKSGADLNVRDQLGSTPLHAAVRWNALKSASQLIKKGLDPNVQNIAGKTPLAEAAVEGNVEMATLLISKGANPNIYDSTGRTALVDAIKGYQPQMTELLLASGANPQIQDMNGRTPFHEAAEMGNLEIIKLLSKAKGNPLSRDKEGRTPLSIAFPKGTQIVNAILGSDKNITDSDGNTPVHIAIANKADSKMVSYLIKKGYPFDTRNSSGYTPLAMAVLQNQTDSANSLLEKGASPFAEINSRGDSVLTLAFKEKNKEMLGYIVKYSANKTDIKGNSILHYAAKFGDPATVKRLLSFGLNKDVKNLAGETPYDLAVNWKNEKVAEMLK